MVTINVYIPICDCYILFAEASLMLMFYSTNRGSQEKWDHCSFSIIPSSFRLTPVFVLILLYNQRELPFESISKTSRCRFGLSNSFQAMGEESNNRFQKPASSNLSATDLNVSAFWSCHQAKLRRIFNSFVTERPNFFLSLFITPDDICSCCCHHFFADTSHGRGHICAVRHSPFISKFSR